MIHHAVIPYRVSPSLSMRHDVSEGVHGEWYINSPSSLARVTSEDIQGRLVDRGALSRTLPPVSGKGWSMICEPDECCPKTPNSYIASPEGAGFNISLLRSIFDQTWQPWELPIRLQASGPPLVTFPKSFCLSPVQSPESQAEGNIHRYLITVITWQLISNNTDDSRHQCWTWAA